MLPVNSNQVVALFISTNVLLGIVDMKCRPQEYKQRGNVEDKHGEISKWAI